MTRITTNHKKVLMLIPRTDDGGLANYYNSIKNKFSIDVDFFRRGTENWPAKESVIRTISRMITDYYNFYFLVRKKKHSIIHLNFFFSLQSLIRESIFLIIAKIHRRKVVIFYRGYDLKAMSIIKKYFLPIFKFVFFRSDSIIVLSSIEKKMMREWGYKKSIFLETTTVDDRLIADINKATLGSKFQNPKNINLLFLSRIEKAKGVYEAIDAFRLIKQKNKYIRLIIAGKGSELNNVRNYIKQNKITDIEIVGFVQGQDKINVFLRSHIYVFPTYSEGLPNSVLEAFSFGLPVITRPVGGLLDIFKNGKNGFITDSKNPPEIAKYIEQLVGDKNLMKSISLHNYNYAQSQFMASVVVRRLEKIYSETLESNK